MNYEKVRDELARLGWRYEDAVFMRIGDRLTSDDIVGVFIDMFGMCGCGRPGEILHAFLVELAIAAQRDAYATDYEPAEEYLRHALDHAGLTEHGGSVYGAWPSSKGKDVFAVLYAAFLCGDIDGEYTKTLRPPRGTQ